MASSEKNLVDLFKPDYPLKRRRRNEGWEEEEEEEEEKDESGQISTGL